MRTKENGQSALTVYTLFSLRHSETSIGEAYSGYVSGLSPNTLIWVN